MKKILLCLVMLVLIVGCKEKHEWKDNYQLTYFYLEDCSNCKHFRDNVIPVIKEEFNNHMEIKAYNMDEEDNFEEMKTTYENHLDQIIDFDDEYYGYGPMVFLEGYIAILGAGNEDDYVEHLIRAIEGNELNEPAEIETFYYLKDGKVKK